MYLRGLLSNDIFALISVFEPDGPTWVKMVDPEGNVPEEDEYADQNPEQISKSGQGSNPELRDETEQHQIVVSHPRRKNHGNNMKKTPPMTPSKSTAENSSCLVERRL